MVTTKLENFSSELELVENGIKSSVNFLNENNLEEQANDIKKLYDERLNKNRKPSIMLYGVYNAGKSSLVNALMNNEVAKVADAPTTDRINKYDWKGITIIDTPGIDAPEEHEIIAQQQIMDTDVVLFLVSDDSPADEIKIWDEIKRLNELNKPLILVINDKKGNLNSNNVEEKEMIIRVQKKFIETAKNKLNKEIEVSVVNVKRALQGKIEKKDLLLKNSQIEFLESKIVDFLKNIDQVKSMLVPIQKAEKYLKDYREQIISNLNTGDDYSKITKYIDDLKEQLQSEGEQVTKNKIIPLKEIIVSIASNQDVNTQDKINNVITERVNETISSFDKKVELITIKAKDEYEDLLKTDNIILDPNIPSPNIVTKQITEENKSIDSKKITSIVPFDQVEKLIFEGLKSYSKKPFFMTNKTWIEKLGGQAKTLTMGLQIVINIVTTVSQIRKEINDIEREKQAKASFIKEINFQASEVVNNLIDQMLNEINISIHNTFKDVVSQIREKKRKQDENSLTLISKKDIIEGIIDNLCDISKKLQVE